MVLEAAASVGVGVSAPVGGYGGQAPYVVSEGEQVIQPGMTSSEVVQRLGYSVLSIRRATGQRDDLELSNALWVVSGLSGQHPAQWHREGRQHGP